MSLPFSFPFGWVCSGPVTEVTTEVRAPKLFLSGFASLSWFVATLVFGSLESFSVTIFMMVFLDQHSHFIYKLGNHLGFCGCTCFDTYNSFGFWLLGYFFVTSADFVDSTILFASG